MNWTDWTDISHFKGYIFATVIATLIGTFIIYLFKQKKNNIENNKNGNTTTETKTAKINHKNGNHVTYNVNNDTTPKKR